MASVHAQPPGPDSWPSYLSLGMVVLDELHFPSGQIMHNVAGGSGAYGPLGARLAASDTRSRAVACLVLAGDDFPVEVAETLESWGMNLEIRRAPGRRSTRGLLKYEDDVFGRKTFRYTTPPLQPVPNDIAGTAFLHSSAFHFLARPDDLEEQVDQLLSHRAAESISQKPLLVWEPAPPHCKLIHQRAHMQACRRVDVFSPNHLELIRLFEGGEGSDRRFDRGLIEQYARRFFQASLAEDGPGTIIVVRAGEHGCLILSSQLDCRWLPSYFHPDNAAVVDPTGAGNCFLGALTRTLSKTGDLMQAAIIGTVAAGFALEQYGLPSLESANGEDLWNGSRFEGRLAKYKRSLYESTGGVVEREAGNKT